MYAVSFSPTQLAAFASESFARHHRLLPGVEQPMRLPHPYWLPSGMAVGAGAGETTRPGTSEPVSANATRLITAAPVVTAPASSSSSGGGVELVVVGDR